MNGPLKEQVEERFPWLLGEAGFHIAGSEYDYKAMGASSVVLTSPALLMKLEYDGWRTSLCVAATAEPGNWMELGFLWYSLTGTRPNPELDGWACFFREHLRELSDALGPGFPATKEAWERAIAESKATLARHVPRPSLRGRLLRGKNTPIGMLVFGPLGWIVAAATIYWHLVR